MQRQTRGSLRSRPFAQTAPAKMTLAKIVVDGHLCCWVHIPPTLGQLFPLIENSSSLLARMGLASAQKETQSDLNLTGPLRRKVDGLSQYA